MKPTFVVVGVGRSGESGIGGSRSAGRGQVGGLEGGFDDVGSRHSAGASARTRGDVSCRCVGGGSYVLLVIGESDQRNSNMMLHLFTAAAVHGPLSSRPTATGYRPNLAIFFLTANKKISKLFQWFSQPNRTQPNPTEPNPTEPN